MKIYLSIVYLALASQAAQVLAQNPSPEPTFAPRPNPTPKPTRAPTPRPTGPTVEPTPRPTKFMPTVYPTLEPIANPTPKPTRVPTARPTVKPTSFRPSPQPSAQPTNQPSSEPSRQPASYPTSIPSNQPFSKPSAQPSVQPTMKPSTQPSSQPTNRPTTLPPENIEIDFFEREKTMEVLSSNSGLVGSLTTASWIFFASLILLLTYLKVQWFMGEQVEKRKKKSNERKRMQLDEEKPESKGMIDENKILFWREHMKMEIERRRILLEDTYIHPPSPPSRSNTHEQLLSLTMPQPLQPRMPEVQANRYSSNQSWNRILNTNSNRKPEIATLSNGLHLNRYKPVALNLKRSAVPSNLQQRSTDVFVQPRSVDNISTRMDNHKRSFTLAAAKRRELSENAAAYSARRANQPSSGYSNIQKSYPLHMRRGRGREMSLSSSQFEELKSDPDDDFSVQYSTSAV